MSKNEHVVIADKEGYFYCRVVDSVMNYKKNQHVCGRGCPCFVECSQGRFVCCYEENTEEDKHAIFPAVSRCLPALHQAYTYAAQAHAKQYRKGTQLPYFTHIITTMNYALGLTQDIEVLQAAILHDTVEDTIVTFEDLRQQFGKRVSMLVKGETENKRHDMPAAQTWEIRKKEAIMNLHNQIVDVKKIVLADKTANAESLVREWQLVGDSIWNKFNQTDKGKQEWYFSAVRANLTELDHTEVMRQFDTYIETLFGTNKDFVK